jgi:hypothetical protein
MTKQQWEPMVARLALVSAYVLILVGCTGNVALGPEAVKGQTPEARSRCMRCKRPISAAAARASCSFAA